MQKKEEENEESVDFILPTEQSEEEKETDESINIKGVEELKKEVEILREKNKELNLVYDESFNNPEGILN